MRLSRLILSSVLILSPIAARADITFTFSGLENGSFTIATATPTTTYTSSIEYTPSTFTGGFSDVFFYTQPTLGGFSDVSDDYGYGGPQIFGGTVGSPSFVDETLAFYAFDGNGNPIDPSGSPVEFVTITGATPEPSSLVLLGTGALGLAGAIRRRFSK